MDRDTMDANGLHNPFFNNEKTQKDTKIFVGVAALTDEMALGFAVWPIGFSDSSTYSR